ncbi:MAG: hypothetical protein ABGY75_01640 [Gemmataceae bacterium]
MKLNEKIVAELATLPAMSAFSNFLASRVQRLAPPTSAAVLDAMPHDGGIAEQDAMAAMISQADLTIPPTQELLSTPGGGGGEDRAAVDRRALDDGRSAIEISSAFTSFSSSTAMKASR